MAIKIHSKILDETIYLSETQVAGKVCYTQEEIELLKTAEKSLGPAEYAAYLKKIHLVKKTFPDSKIEDIKMDEPVAPPGPMIEETIPVAEPPKQKSLWEL